MTPPWNDRRDRQILARVAGGDRDALADLFGAHADRLFGHAFALTRRREDAEDLVQGVFVTVAAMGPRLLGIRSFGAYAHRMIRTAAIDRQRHGAVAGERPLESAKAAFEGGMEAEERLALESALDRLPAEQREVVLLHVVEGLTFREIAATTATRMWTVASRYRLGMTRLRQELDDDGRT